MPFVNHPVAGRDAHQLPDHARPAEAPARSSGTWSDRAPSSSSPRRRSCSSVTRRRSSSATWPGSRTWSGCPSAVFVIDTKKEHIAVKEARKLGIPVVAIVDTNCDPDEVDYVIPGNDDAIRACALVTRVVADALQEGQYLAYQGMQARGAQPEFEPEPGATTFGAEDGEQRRTRLSDEEAAWMGEAVGEGGPGSGETGEQAGEPAPASRPGSLPRKSRWRNPRPRPKTDTADVVPEPAEPEPAEPAPEPAADPRPSAEAEPVDAPPAESAGDGDGSTAAATRPPRRHPTPRSGRSQRPPSRRPRPRPRPAEPERGVRHPTPTSNAD